MTGRPALAADVYDTTAAHLTTSDNIDLVIEANLRLGSVALAAC